MNSGRVVYSKRPSLFMFLRASTLSKGYAVFYPFYSIRIVGGHCLWQLGNHIPGSKNDFGQNNQYGQLLNLTCTTLGGGPTTRYNDFRQILSRNSCQAS